MYVLLRRLGEHRGAPRLYLDTVALARAGLAPGTAIELVAGDGDEARLTIRACPSGTRRVSSKHRGRHLVPVIDLNNQRELQPFTAAGVVRIVIEATAVHILLPASVRQALARTSRLATRLASRQPLRCASLAFGAGIASWALHEGLADAGVPCTLALANEIGEEYLDLACANNPTVKASTTAVATPMQELVVDEWLLARIGSVEVLEAGIPCSGASKAGRAKRGLARMEDHPWVGHLIGAVLVAIARLQPAIVVIENVQSYRETASAAILRGWLRDAGYAIDEVVLDASAFGSLESRIRWFLVASPPQLKPELSTVAPSQELQPVLGEILEPIPGDDERFRAVEYLKEKALRDKDAGKGFAMQWLTPQSRHVPTLRKGYHKGGSSDPRLIHPTDPSRSRLLTGVEHARIKGVDEGLLRGASDTLVHQVCGQAVDVRPVRAIGRAIGAALGRFAHGGVEPSARLDLAPAVVG